MNLTSDALPAGVAEGFDIQTLNKQTVIASTSSVCDVTCYCWYSQAKLLLLQVAARNEPVYPSPLVPFVNIEGAGVKATFLLRNPCYGLEISTKTLKSLVGCDYYRRQCAPVITDLLLGDKSVWKRHKST